MQEVERIQAMLTLNSVLHFVVLQLPSGIHHAPFKFTRHVVLNGVLGMRNE